MIELSIKKKLKSPTGDMLLDVKFEIITGNLVALYGKSGVGKTSLLKIIAGLLKPEKGRIKVNDTIWLDTDKGLSLSTQRRNIGFVFQEYTLFPNMTVKENLEFALKRHQPDKIIDELLEIVDLGDLRFRKPDSLSGGQKQRVALARALVQKPEILMLDEPLSALDYEMRDKLQQYILQLHREFKLTTILISHDISEILKMSDYLMEIDRGKIVNKGLASEVFSHNKINAKFQFTGEIIKIEKQDFIYIISVIIGKDMVKVIADDDEANDLMVGDKVFIASKAFNPIIKKI